MDKFDEFLKEKVNDEKSEFVVSKRYDTNLEKCLKDLDSKKHIRWNKAIISVAACFIFVLLVGFSSRDINVNKSLNDNSRISSVSEEERSIQNRAYQGVNNIINIDDIKTLTFKVLGENSTYKFLDNKKDITSVIEYINSIATREIPKVETKEWDIFIQTNGSINHSIIIEENVMNVDDRWFEINEDEVKNIESIYSNLRYEEIPIKYCNF